MADDKNLKKEQTAVNQAIKSIEDILEAAQKTTTDALSIKRIKETETEAEATGGITVLSPEAFGESSDEEQELRNVTAQKINEDKELAGYFVGQKSKLDNEKVDELYSLVKPGEKFIRHSYLDRLTNAEELPKKSPEVFEQTVLFDNPEAEDGLKTGELDEDFLNKPEASKAAVFDDDYASLSEKILSGELSLSEEEEDDDQLKMNFGGNAELGEMPEPSTLDATDINLRLAFNMLDSDISLPTDIDEIDEDEMYERSSKRKGRTGKRINNEIASVSEPEEYEYTSSDQNGEISAMLNGAVKAWKKKLALVALFMLGIIYMELATKNSEFHPVYIRQGRYGLLYILVDLQLLLFTAITMLGSLAKGLKDLIKLKPTAETLLVLAMAFPAAHSVYCAFSAPTEPTLLLYNLGGAVAAFMLCAVRLMQSNHDVRTFEIISAPGQKFAAASLSGSTKEADEFYKYLFNDSEIYTVKRTEFISDFFKRIKKRPKSDDIISIQIPVVILASAALFIFNYTSTKDIFGSYRLAAAIFATSLPLTAMLVSILPSSVAGKLALRSESAFVGSCVPDEYDSAAVISFADTEVFPESSVRVTSLQTYGDFRIDRIISDLARIFEKLGGPLSKVFEKTLSEKPVPATTFKLIDSAADGLLIALEGKDVFIGRRAFMRRYRFSVPYDEADSDFENKNGSVMYIAINEEIAAKVHLQYRINPRFDALLKDMYRAGVCVGIKTLDPNINNELLIKSIKFKKCPIAILKADAPEDLCANEESISSGIVTNGSLHTFLKTFILADKTRHSVKTNKLISFAGIFLSAAIVAFLVFSGADGSLNSVFAMLFQLLWALPIYLLSHLL